ncbi:DUF4214 domain-containing protein [Undibacterium sp. Ji83W]|uniref:DUF4214 domain-containing protein n=1 Tax=Undibacterium sp. Ji83W TaxID=3413043 RepID=UPI003BF32E1D
MSGLITQNPAADAVSYNFYNAENQLIGSVNAEGYATEYQYNLDGQLAQTTRYNNKANNVSPNVAWESVKPVADAVSDLVSKQTYDALGRAQTSIAASGSVTTSFYDDNTGWLVRQKLNPGTGQSRFQNLKYDQYGRVIGEMSGIGGWQLNTGAISEATAWQNYGTNHTYDAGNRRTSSTDQNGHRTLFYYDQAGHLTHTINALGEVTENRYNHLGQLTDTITYGTRLTNVSSLAGGLITSSLTQSLAASANNQLDSVQHLTYDLDGRVATTTDAKGITTTYSYDQFGERTSITSLISDTENVVSKTSYNKLGQVTETIQDANGIKQAVHTDYDAFGRAIRSVDANGNVTTQIFDRLGRAVEVIDQASGHSNKTSYNAFNQTLTLTDAKGNISTYSYKNTVLLSETKQTSAEGSIVITTVNPYGQVAASTDGKGNTTSVTYDRDGNLKLKSTSDGTNNFFTSNVYDNADLLKESTDANGNKTTYTYDDANRLISKTLTIAGSAPLVTTYVYDAKGQQVEITDPNNVKTKLEYDLKGQLIKQTVDPDGLKLVTEYDYDKRGKTLKVTQKGETQDLVQRYVFDKLGRRIEEYTGTTLTRSYQYDANNNVISSKDALNNVTRFAYDSEDHQILVLDAAGGIQRTTYDENGRVKSVRRYATAVNLTGLSAQPTRAALEALIPAETAQDRFSTNTYDKDGRVISTVDALGGVVSYVYDVNNNVIKKTSGDGVNPANDRTQWFAYDGMNRLTVSVAADGSITSSTYDGNGNVTNTTAYANRVSTANLAVGATSQTYLNQVQVNAQQDRTTRFAYDAANRLAYSVDAQGYVTKNTYEGTHLKSTTQYDQPIVVANSNLASIQAAVSSSAKDRISSYEYDHAGHLLKTTDAMGFTEKYTYNSLGQKDSFTNKKGATWTYTYDAVGRLETEKAPAVEVATIDLKNGAKSSSSAMIALETRFVYDAVGNLKARIEASNSDQQRRTEYTYDALGRQIGVTYPPVDVTDSNTGVTIIGKQLTTRVTYDTLGNAVSNIDVAGKRSYKVYDQLGRVRFDIDANGYLTEYKRNTFGEVESLIRYANDKRDTSSETAPALAQIVPLASAKDRQIKTQYNQLGQAAVVTESVFYGSDGTHYEYQAKVTTNTYNAFGELSSAAVGRNVYDANGSLLQAGVDIATTRYAYNQRGQQVAILDAENYLTRQQFDAYGNVISHVEFAAAYASLAASWTGSDAGLPVADVSLIGGASDRGVHYEYDLINRKISETKLNVEFSQLSSVNRTDVNAHGSVKTQYGYDELGNLVSTTEQEIDSGRASSGISNIGLITRTSYITYDMLGRVASTTSSGSGTSNTGTYTVYKRDAYGNAIVTTQTPMTQGSQSGNPLMTYMGSMNAGQNLLEGQALYSANGRFQLVMQADGNLVMYDRQQGNASAPGLIWQSGTHAPSGSTGLAVQTDGNLVIYHAGAPLWQSSTSGSGMVLRLRDDGNLVLTNASQQIVWQTATIIAPSTANADVRESYAQYNAFGKVTDSVDAADKRSHQSYDANGNLVAQQRKVTDLNGQVVGNSDTSAMVSMEYDATGKLTRTVELGVAGSSDTTETRYEYNAFGELQRQAVNGKTTLLNEYDNEGHLWRTTSGGITKVMLVDQEGRNTVQVTSAVDLNGFADASAVAARIQTDGQFTSSVTRYDHLGHVIEKQLPNVGNSSKLEVTAQSSALSYKVIGTIDNNSTNVSNGRHDPNEPKGQTSDVSNSAFTGYNNVQITMPDMSTWGYGDVKVSIQFKTKLDPQGGSPTLGRIDKVYEAMQAKGVLEVFWNNDPAWALAAQDNITEIVISKKDATGHWITVNKLGPTQSNSNNAILQIVAPIDLNTTPKLRYRVKGDVNWSEGKLTNFGNFYIFNPQDGKYVADTGNAQGINRALAEGIYEYEVDYSQSNAVVSHSSGNMTVGYGDERIKIAQLYVALLNRAPTDTELNAAVDASHGKTLDQIAQAMLNQSDLVNLSVDAILDRIYTGALGRNIDAAGKTYWVAQWNSGSTNAHGSVVADIIRGTVAYTGDVAAIIESSKLFNNRVSVALTYGAELKGHDINVATQILLKVSATDTTAALAVGSVGNLVTDAQARLQMTRLYVLLLNRSPEFAGLDYYAGELKTKSRTINDEATVILSQSPLAGKSNDVIADTLFDTVLNWKDSAAKSDFLRELNKTTTLAQKATVILSLIDKVVGNTNVDFESRQAQQLFNNRVNVGMLYANSFSLRSVEDAATINALVTATDTLTAINAVFAKLNAAQNKQLNLTRLYVMLFNRAPDPKGYKYWLQQSNLDSNISFSTIANAIWTDKFATVSNIDLVKQIYANTLGGDAASVTDSNQWVKELNVAGQPGAASKGEVLERMINDLVNPSGSANFSSYARQVFALKSATGMNFVALGGGDVTEATIALTAVESDLKSMSASLALQQAKANVAAATDKLAKAQQGADATKLAASMIAYEASAAALAYAKAQLQTTLTDFTKVDNDLTTAQNNLNTWVEQKKIVDKDLSLATALVQSADSAVAFANAAVQADNAIANQAALARAQQAKLEAEIQEGLAKVNQQGAAKALQDAQDNVQRLKDRRDALETAKKTAADNYAAAASDLTQKTNDRDAAQRTVDDNTITAANASAAFAKITAPLTSPNRLTIYQLYNIIFGEANPDLAGVQYWQATLDSGRMTVKQVIHAMYFDPSRRVNYLSPSSFFSRIYSSALNLSSSDPGAIWWADTLQNAPDDNSIYPDPLGRPDKAEQIYTFYNGLLNEAYQGPYVGYANLQRVSTQSKDAGAVIIARAQSDFDNATAALALANKTLGERKGYMAEAENRLRSTPTDAQAISDFDEAKSRYDLAAGNITSFQTAFDNSVSAVNAAHGWVTYFQNQVNGLQPAGGNATPSGDVMNTLVGALSDYTVKKGLAEDAPKFAKKTSEALDAISQANPEHLKQVLQLYVLLFNRTDPDSAGVAYWVTRMKEGMQIVDIATSMYHDTNTYVNEGLDKKDPNVLMAGIYTNSLSRFDNDTAGVTYWANKLRAEPAQTQGAIFNALIFSVLNNENPDAQFLATRDKFIGKVNLAVSHAVSNASNALAVANAAVTKTASDASLALQRYLALKDAAGTAGANISIPTTTATATNLASILQVIMLLTNNQNIAPTFTVKMGGWIDGIATGKETVDTIAGKIYSELNLNSVGSYSLIQSIYYGALGRTAPDPLNGESYWASRLDTARQSGEAAIGNVFNSLISGLSSETSVISVAFASRRLFDQKVATFISNFQSVQQAFINSVLIPAKYGDGQVLVDAQRTFDQAKIASDIAHQNASAVYGVSTAPTISATEAQKSVARLYALMFNRAPETSGLSYWSASVGSTNLSSIAQLMLDGAKPGDLPAGLSNASFVNLIYSNLGSTDSKNIATHINDLSTKTRGQVVYEILSETMSNGTADQASADRLRLLANKTAVGLTYALTMNGDSVGVARTLFANVTADNATAGINAALNTKPAVYARTQVASLFIMMFGREADLDGFDHWAERIPAIDAPLADRVMFVQNMISGDAAHTLEAYSLNDTDFINKIYTNAFGQQPDAAGRNYWLQQLGSKSRAEVILGILYDTQNSPASASADATTQLQFRLNQKSFNEKLSSALNHLAVLEQTKLTNAGQVDQGNLDQLKTAASVAAGLAIAADLAALQAMGDIGRISQIPKAADISWIPTLNINNGSNSTPIAPAGYNSVIQTNDRWGNVLSATDVRDPKLLTRYHYDSDNRLIETTRNDGFKDIKITDAYNSLGQKIGAMDANGNISFNVLDANGHVLEEHRADGHVARQDYNAFGDRTSYTDASGYQTTFKYDAMGRVSSQTQVGAVDVYHSTNLIYDGGEEYEATKQLTISYKYDELGRRIQTTDAAGGILRTWYDLRGNVIKADNESHTSGSNGTQTTSRFDALNHKVNETDAINGQKNWVYDIATGRLVSKTDLGGHTTQYDYNYYNQVVGEHGDGVIYKKDIKTTYNQLGQVLTIQDAGTSTYTYYQYDVAGNRLSENVTQVNNTHVSVLQDNHLSYDKLGRLAVVQTDRYSLTYAYDNNGNRTMVSSYYVTDTAASTNANGELVNTVGGNQINSKEQIKTTWNTYDAMNRQVIVDGVKTDGIIGISAEQGHQFTYDNEGRRLSDTSYGKKITSTSANVLGIPVTMTGTTAGNITETYTYDTIGRLNTISRDGVEIDKRYYNANSQLVRSGVSNDLINQIRGNSDLKKSFQDAGVSAEFTIYQYQTDKVNQLDIQQVHTAIAGAEFSGTRFHYDDAGRMTLYTQDTKTVVGYHYDASAQFDQYQASEVVGNRGGGEATTVNSYDVNGHLIKVTDSTKTSNTRNLFVDTAGHILRKEQLGDNTYSLLINDQIIGTSSKDYVSDTINQSYVKQSALAGSGPSIYVAQQGDTLQSIAKAVWGDATLWYLIADANGLATTEPQSGAKLLIPAREVSGGNRVDTFRPYNPGEIIGDTTPNMPMPAGQDGCGGMGMIIIAAIAIVATIMTAGAASILMAQGAAGLAGSSMGVIMTTGATALAGGGVGVAAAGWGLAAASAAVGSVVSQGAAIAMNMQDGFNWKSVALSALSAGISTGLPATLPGFDPGTMNVMAKAALGSAITQGIGIATGLQDSFSWRNVAASAAGAGVGKEVGDWLDTNKVFADMESFGSNVARGTVSGFAAGVTVAAMRGGRVEMAQIARDAFGNALGESLATSNRSDYAARIKEPSTTFFKPGELEKVNVPYIDDILNPAVQNATGSNGSWGEYDPYASKYPSRFRFRAEPASSAKGVNGTLVQGNDTTTLYQTEMQTVEISHKKLTPDEIRALDEEHATDVSWQMSMPNWSFKETSRSINEKRKLIALEQQRVAIANGPQAWAAQAPIAKSGILSPVHAGAWHYQQALSLQDGIVNEFGGLVVRAGVRVVAPAWTAAKTALYSETTLLRSELDATIRAGLNADLKMGPRIGGLEASQANVFVARMESQVASEAADIIANGGKGGIAYARAGSASAGIMSKGFKNIPSAMGEFPGVQRVAGVNGEYTISDTDAFISGVRDAYARSGQKLNGLTAQQIRDYVSSEKVFAQQAGVPGLHAEVQAANDLYNKLVNPAGALMNGDISVVTYKLGKTSGSGMQGGPFLACSNCGGILPPQINVVTGRKLFQ